VLRRIFGTRREAEEHCITKSITIGTFHEMLWGGQIKECEMGGIHKILVKKHDRKIPLEKNTHRWEDNIDTHSEEIGSKSVCWMHLAQYREFLDYYPLKTIRSVELISSIINIYLGAGVI